MNLPLAMRPLGENNRAASIPECSIKKVSADSTGVENDTSKIIKHHHSVKKVQTTSVAKRNLRERTRVKGVNDGFGKLKMYVPDMRNKSSKVETLRGAIEYIKRLKELLGEEIDDTPMADIKFEEDDTNDSLTFSDLTDSSFSSRICDQTPETYLNPMVYQLPSSTPYHLPHSDSSPILLPSVSLLSPNQDRLIITTSNIPSILTPETNPLHRPPSVPSQHADNSGEKLPSFNITAPS